MKMIDAFTFLFLMGCVTNVLLMLELVNKE